MRDSIVKPDAWSEGYIAARDCERDYCHNPYATEPQATAWAFGCSEGIKERNRRGIAHIMRGLRACN